MKQPRHLQNPEIITSYINKGYTVRHIVIYNILTTYKGTYDKCKWKKTNINDLDLELDKIYSKKTEEAYKGQGNNG